MKLKNRFVQLCLVLILGLGLVGAGWAGSRIRSENMTVYYRTDLTILVDGRETTFEVEPFIIDPGWIMVPVEFVSKELGVDVSWDDATSTFSISTGKTSDQYVEQDLRDAPELTLDWTGADPILSFDDDEAWRDSISRIWFYAVLEVDYNGYSVTAWRLEVIDYDVAPGVILLYAPDLYKRRQVTPEDLPYEWNMDDVPFVLFQIVAPGHEDAVVIFPLDSLETGYELLEM